MYKICTFLSIFDIRHFALMTIIVDEKKPFCDVTLQAVGLLPFEFHPTQSFWFQREDFYP